MMSHIKSDCLILTIQDKSTLYAAYMPFIQDGGLYIPTHRNYSLGQKVTLLLQLGDTKKVFMVDVKVVWFTPKDAQGNRAPGIGVQLEGDAGKIVKNKIESYLSDEVAYGSSAYIL